MNENEEASTPLSALNRINASHSMVDVRFVDVLYERLLIKVGKRKGETLPKLSCYMIDQTGASMYAECFSADADRMRTVVVRLWG